MNIQVLADTLWLEYCEVFPKLVKFDCPKIELSNRLRSTMAKNVACDNRIVLANKYIPMNKAVMLGQVLPHELAHQIDVNLNGIWKKNEAFHRKTWVNIMIAIGQPPHLAYKVIEPC